MADLNAVSALCLAGFSAALLYTMVSLTKVLLSFAITTVQKRKALGIYLSKMMKYVLHLYWDSRNPSFKSKIIFH